MLSLNEYELAIRQEVDSGRIPVDTGIEMIETAVQAEIVAFNTMKMMEALTLTTTEE